MNLLEDFIIVYELSHCFCVKVNFQQRCSSFFFYSYLYIYLLHFFFSLFFIPFYFLFFLPSFYSIEADNKHLMYSIIALYPSLSSLLLTYAFFFSLTYNITCSFLPLQSKQNGPLFI